MQDNKFKFDKTREFGELISDTFNFAKFYYVELWQVFLKFIIPFLAPILLLTFYVEYNTTSSFDFDISNPTSINQINQQDLDFSLIIINLIIALLSIVLFVVMELAILGAVKSYHEKGSFSNDFISKVIKSQFSNAIGLSILIGLIIVIGAFLCVIPGIYFFVVFSIALPLLVFKDMTTGEIINECFRLIKDNWWVTFGAIIVFGLIVLLISIILTIPAEIYMAIAELTNTEMVNYSTFDKIIIALFSSIGMFFQYVFNVLSILLSAIIYFNLNEQKYGESDLDEIDQIGDF